MSRSSRNSCTRSAQWTLRSRVCQPRERDGVAGGGSRVYARGLFESIRPVSWAYHSTISHTVPEVRLAEVRVLHSLGPTPMSVPDLGSCPSGMYLDIRSLEKSGKGGMACSHDWLPSEAAVSSWTNSLASGRRRSCRN